MVKIQPHETDLNCKYKVWYTDNRTCTHFSTLFVSAPVICRLLARRDFKTAGHLLTPQIPSFGSCCHFLVWHQHGKWQDKFETESSTHLPYLNGKLSYFSHFEEWLTEMGLMSHHVYPLGKQEGKNCYLILGILWPIFFFKVKYKLGKSFRTMYLPEYCGCLCLKKIFIHFSIKDCFPLIYWKSIFSSSILYIQWMVNLFLSFPVIFTTVSDSIQYLYCQSNWSFTAEVLMSLLPEKWRTLLDIEATVRLLIWERVCSLHSANH